VCGRSMNNQRRVSLQVAALKSRTPFSDSEGSDGEDSISDVSDWERPRFQTAVAIQRQPRWYVALTVAAVSTLSCCFTLPLLVLWPVVMIALSVAAAVVVCFELSLWAGTSSEFVGALYPCIPWKTISHALLLHDDRTRCMYGGLRLTPRQIRGRLWSVVDFARKLLLLKRRLPS
jgi:hypothetical protein